MVKRMKLTNPRILSWSVGVATVVNHGNPRINAMTAKMRGPFHPGIAHKFLETTPT